MGTRHNGGAGVGGELAALRARVAELEAREAGALEAAKAALRSDAERRLRAKLAINLKEELRNELYDEVRAEVVEELEHDLVSHLTDSQIERHVRRPLEEKAREIRRVLEQDMFATVEQRVQEELRSRTAKQGATPVSGPNRPVRRTGQSSTPAERAEEQRLRSQLANLEARHTKELKALNAELNGLRKAVQQQALKVDELTEANSILQSELLEAHSALSAAALAAAEAEAGRVDAGVQTPFPARDILAPFEIPVAGRPRMTSVTSLLSEGGESLVPLAAPPPAEAPLLSTDKAPGDIQHPSEPLEAIDTIDMTDSERGTPVMYADPRIRAVRDCGDHDSSPNTAPAVELARSDVDELDGGLGANPWTSNRQDPGSPDATPPKMTTPTAMPLEKAIDDTLQTQIIAHFSRELQEQTKFMETPPLQIPDVPIGGLLENAVQHLFRLWDYVEEAFCVRNVCLLQIREALDAGNIDDALRLAQAELVRCKRVKDEFGAIFDLVRKREQQKADDEPLANITAEIRSVLSECTSELLYRGFPYLEVLQAES
ncbi:hypothetical protein GMRT_13145 [Giardia muris]|uniref:Uncharacterized protein n=1 Tax=Giardia muris TaxID=5742 RepID=A0A4Z1SP76_GIAMU|nr:hypothetical protein GMRT_13145 [Giardia muris]|eukprot:TNJ26665.1 hypothetical protein GMRT_13145 [Giardia muris]